MEHCTKKPGSEKELRSSLGDRDMPTFALRAPVGNLRLHRERRLVDQTMLNWNHILPWLSYVDNLRQSGRVDELLQICSDTSTQPALRN